METSHKYHCEKSKAAPRHTQLTLIQKYADSIRVVLHKSGFLHTCLIL